MSCVNNVNDDVNVEFHWFYLVRVNFRFFHYHSQRFGTKLGLNILMGSVLFLDTCATAGDILYAGLLGAYHVEYLAEMVALLIAFDVVYFLFCVH